MKFFAQSMLGVLLALSISSQTQAATIIVNSVSGGTGGSACTLADAIISANTGSTSAGCSSGSIGSDEIVFDSSLNGSTILLSANLPTVTDDLIVTAPSGVNQITISGGNAYSMFIISGATFSGVNLKLIEGRGTATSHNGFVNNGGAVAALMGAAVTLENCTLSNNFADNMGGAVFGGYTSNVSLTNCLISNNSSSNGGGVAAYYANNLDVINSTISNNSAVLLAGSFAEIGGGLSTSLSTVKVRNSAFIGNTANGRGGAIQVNDHSLVDVVDGTFSGNSAVYYGGAINVQLGGVAGPGSIVNLRRSSFFDNTVTFRGGAISVADSTINVLNTIFENNGAQFGGVIYSSYSVATLNTVFASDNHAYAGGAINVRNNSTLSLVRSFLSSNNASGYGGAVSAESGAYMTINDSTLSNNSASVRGGAVLSDTSIVEITNSTISNNYAGNEGGVIFADNGSSIKLANSTSAENSGGSLFVFNSSGALLTNTVLADGGCDQDPIGSVVLSGGVHIDDGTCGATSTGPSSLGPLALNGIIQIPTHLPAPGSPLIDQGVGVAGNNPANDQRGLTRIVGAAIDIGSVELQDPE